MQSAAWTYREAKLLEAGVYADKGVVLTEAHLEGLTRAFRAPVPILVEHRPAPLVLGWLVGVWRQGDALYGRLALFPEADALLRRLRLRGLSVGLSRDLRRLLEVSVTASPRVPSAQLFHAAPTARRVGVSPTSLTCDADSCARTADAFRTYSEEVIRLETVEIRDSSAGTPTRRHDEPSAGTPTRRHDEPSAGTPTRRHDEPSAGTPAHLELLETRVRELEAELRRREAREQIQQWSLRGQLPPTLAPIAEAILLQGDAPVQFSGTTTSVAELFRQFVSSLPPQNLLTELAPMPEADAPSFSADALEFLRRAFPDMDPAEILPKEVR